MQRRHAPAHDLRGRDGRRVRDRRARVEALGQPGCTAVGTAVLDTHAPAGCVDFVPADVNVQVLARILAILQPARLGPEAEVGVAGFGEDAGVVVVALGVVLRDLVEAVQAGVAWPWPSLSASADAHPSALNNSHHRVYIGARSVEIGASWQCRPRLESP